MHVAGALQRLFLDPVGAVVQFQRDGFDPVRQAMQQLG